MDLRDRRYWPELKRQFLSAAAYLLSAFEGLSFMLALHRFPGQEASGAVVIVLSVCGIISMIAGKKKFEKVTCCTIAVICILHSIVIQIVAPNIPDKFGVVIMLALPITMLMHVLDIEEES